MSDIITQRLKKAIREANPGMGDYAVSSSAAAVLEMVVSSLKAERNALVARAAAIARANTTAPQIYVDKATGWISPAGEEIAAAIEEMRV